MSSPFSKNRGPVLKCKRDTHDLSFQNNLTMKLGYLYPCLCKEVSAGDTWHLSPAFGLRFLPTFFPLQTKMRAKLDFFYVRNRNIYDDWKNWRYGTGNPSPFPVLSESETFEQSKTGSLGDYLGLPSTLVGGGQYLGLASFITPQTSLPLNLNLGVYNSKLILNTSTIKSNKPSSSINSFCVITLGGSSPFPQSEISSWTKKNGNQIITSFALTSLQYDALSTGKDFHVGYASYSDNTFTLIGEFGPERFVLDPDDGTWHFIVTDPSSLLNKYFVYWQNSSDLNINDRFIDNVSFMVHSDTTSHAFTVTEATETFETIPYQVSALPFRAYEQIYNAFYRDDRNNPLLVNGVYDPNVFLPNSKGGVDNTPYRLHQRNWEQDFLTSAVPNPQFGNAPLVGLTNVSASGVATLSVDDQEYTTKLEYDENDKVTSFSATPSVAANRKLIDLASSGISINDLRAVNSLQKYLELHYRRGLRYRDQMMAHRGIEVGYDELDMPEFIGSAVQAVGVQQINQTSIGTDDDPLGSYAGQLSAVGGSPRMSKYCDEDGYIIGIISVVPVPAYSQLLPKHFTKINDPLEYFDPSFRNLGYQAIPYREVCPLQAANSGVPLDSTFGYNRAWYDYLQSQDEIHGQFRTTLYNYVLARVFNTVPSLTPDFLTVNPDDLNDVFSISSIIPPGSSKPVSIDTILGQIHFDISVERQIPAYAIPGL